MGHVKEEVFPAHRSDRWRTIYPILKSQVVNLEEKNKAKDLRTLGSLKKAVA